MFCLLHHSAICFPFLCPIGGIPLHQFLEINLMTIKVRSFYAGIPNFSIYCNPAAATHSRSVNHNRIQRNNGRNLLRLRYLADKLHHRNRTNGNDCIIMLSSIQLLAAALGRPWQGWNLVSAHGRTCDPVAECMQGRPTFFLTGGSEDPATLCAQLEAEGFGDVQGVVGQCLGTPEEKLFRGSVKELAAGRFNSLSVLLVEAAEVLPRRAPGLPDEAFERGDVPMTKQEVRAAVLAKLAVRPEDILWDVGAGTGSVSVELALAAPRGRVYAVECRPEGCALIKANREKFRTRNLVLVEGLAPAALSDLPAPDAVVYLQVDPAVSQKLMTGRYHGDESRKDVHEKDIEYLARSRRAAEYCAEHLGWATIHCTENGAMRTIEEIQAEVRALAEKELG